MAAIIQVNEQDIRFIRLRQPVSLRSENNSFGDRLRGVVTHITPKVGLRRQLSDNPKADTDSEARTIDVEVQIDPDQIPLIAHLTGAKVIAQFPK
jgi:HlyD family secretion protein